MVVTLKKSEKIELAETFGLLSDATRLGIVLCCLNKRNSAGEISKKLEISPSLASHHLRLLRAGRMLKSDREGKQVFYQISDDCVREILNIMVNHLFVHEQSGDE